LYNSFNKTYIIPPSHSNISHLRQPSTLDMEALLLKLYKIFDILEKLFGLSKSGSPTFTVILMAQF